MDAVQVCLGNEAGGRVAVLFDGSEGSHVAMQHAIAVARQRHGRLTVIAVAPKPWVTVGMGGICPGVCPARLEQEMIEHIQRAVREAVASIPDDIPCTTMLRCGAPGRECRRVLREHEHDILIMAPPRRSGRRPARGPQPSPVTA